MHHSTHLSRKLARQGEQARLRAALLVTLSQPLGGGWRRLVVGGSWWLVAVSGWQLAVNGGWRWAAVGGGRFLGAVLKGLSFTKKKEFLRTAL